MAWRPHGRARIDPNSPSALAVCDRCNFLTNLDSLTYQFDWRGPRLANLRIKVCRTCLDKPFQFFRPIILPPDPIPRADPRPESFDAEMGPTPTPYDPINNFPPLPPVITVIYGLLQGWNQDWGFVYESVVSTGDFGTIGDTLNPPAIDLGTIA